MITKIPFGAKRAKFRAEEEDGNGGADNCGGAALSGLGAKAVLGVQAPSADAFTRRGNASIVIHIVFRALFRHRCRQARWRTRLRHGRQGENTMNIDSNLNSLQANRDGSASIAAPPHKADEQGRHFLLPWRLNADTSRSLWQQRADAGCGNCPAD